jgi:toxin HigB-1
LRKQYVKTINTLSSINKIEDLFLFKSLDYKKKEGNLQGISAVKVNQQYRILFTEHVLDENSTEIEILPFDTMMHYKLKAFCQM